jgi:hypothetical protein
MTLKCYNKPNRSKPRHFSEKDVGRIACKVLRQGGSETLIMKELQKCMKDPCKREKIDALVKSIAENAVSMLVALAVAQAAVRAVRVVLTVSKRIPFIAKILRKADKKTVQAEESMKKAQDAVKEIIKRNQELLREQAKTKVPENIL